MNEWIIECLNKWLHDLTNDWMNNWMNNWMNGQTKGWMNELSNVWINDLVNDWENGRSNGRIFKCVNELKHENKILLICKLHIAKKRVEICLSIEYNGTDESLVYYLSMIG